MDNYLITGYHGTPHVTAENDRGIHAAIFGPGRFVLPVGEMFRAEYIGNNTIRMYDGKLMDNGAAAGIPAGRYIELLIPEAGQGKYRSDIIAFHYKKDPSTLVESGSFVVVQGPESAVYPGDDPDMVSADLLTDTATEDYMELWRVEVSATVISAPVRLFSVSKNMQSVVPVVDAVSADGFTYAATVDGIDKMYTGLSVTIVPKTTSTTKYPLLSVNGLGAEQIKRRISGQAVLTTDGPSDGWLVADKPVTVTFNGSDWITADPKPSASDIYGNVPITGGGTGANTLEKAQKNLQIHPAIESPDHPGHYYRNVDDEMEWLNPPMLEGVEYRTTERFVGSPVYAKIVKGVAPDAGSKGKVTIAFGATGLLRIECYNAMSQITPATAPYTYEISSTILRGIIDNSNSKWLPADSVVFRAWYIKDNITNLLGGDG